MGCKGTENWQLFTTRPVHTRFFWKQDFAIRHCVAVWAIGFSNMCKKSTSPPQASTLPQATDSAKAVAKCLDRTCTMTLPGPLWFLSRGARWGAFGQLRSASLTRTFRVLGGGVSDWTCIVSLKQHCRSGSVVLAQLVIAGSHRRNGCCRCGSCWRWSCLFTSVKRAAEQSAKWSSTQNPSAFNHMKEHKICSKNQRRQIVKNAKYLFDPLQQI